MMKTSLQLTGTKFKEGTQMRLSYIVVTLIETILQFYIHLN